jgi:signal transduction histidine kinase
MLVNLINDLKDFAKEVNKTFCLNKTFFSLPESINRVIETMRFISESKNVKTVLEINNNDSKFLSLIYEDQCRLEQIMLNFVSNALNLAL